MNPTDELVTLTKRALGLNDYRLHTYRFRRKGNLLGKTEYTLEMEWLPPHADPPDEDGSNPPGTACVEVDVHSRRFQSIIFVGGQSAAEGIRFLGEDGQDVIRWMEKETGLVYGEHFYLIQKEQGKYQFAAGVKGVPVAPAGILEIELDGEGKLIFFTKYGYFPSSQEVRHEPFSLTLEQVEPIARQQLKRFHFPSQKRKRIIPVYALEEVFVSNDLSTIFPADPLIETPSALSMDETLYWDKGLDQPFDRREMEPFEEVTPDQAFRGEASPDVKPITPEEQRACREAVIRFLGQVYPQESGQWRLNALYREQGYIFAVLRRNGDDPFILKRKLTAIIDPRQFEVLNYVDNGNFLEVFSRWPMSSAVTMTKEEAFAKLKEFLLLTPTYVYDRVHKRYRLCGKLDCTYAVQAETGEVLRLEDI